MFVGKYLVVKVQKPELFCTGLTYTCQCPGGWVGEDKHVTADPLTQDEDWCTNDSVSSCRQISTVVSWKYYFFFLNNGLVGFPPGISKGSPPLVGIYKS